MTDVTSLVNDFLKQREAPLIARPRRGELTPTSDEFLKGATRIHAMIASLQKYIVSIRPSYLALEAVDWITNPQASSHHHEPPSPLPPPPRVPEKRLSDDERNQINHSITKFIREYELSISNLASAEALRQQTQATVLQRKFPLENSRLWKWAQGVGGKDSSSKASAKSGEQARLEAVEATLKTVRENVLWTLRRGLEVAVEMQRGMVEKRIQDVKQQEIDMIRMVSKKKDPVLPIPGAMPLWQEEGEEAAAIAAQQGGAYVPDVRETRGKGGALDEQAAAELQAEMSQEQLQLVEEENQGLLQHYEDTLSKVHNAEQSLHDISSIQQTLVGYLAQQEEHIDHLADEAFNTEENVGRANKQLHYATGRKSTARVVFWSTVGLCAWLVVWDAIY